MSETPSASRGLKGRDLITVGIFTALYFVINFLFMLLSGLHPYLWVFMPAIDALFAGIPFMLACAKVPKFGTVLIIGMVPSLIYFITGMFTPLILGLTLASYAVAEIIRAVRIADSIAVIGDGHVIEQGTHEELVARGGKYAAMWAADRQLA